MQDSQGLVPKSFRKGKTTMKKTLAIVLALVMVLCMVPAMSAETTQTITDKSYNLKVWDASKLTNANALGTAEQANSVTAKYNYEEIDAVTTGKWSDDTKMAIVEVSGFNFAKGDVETITIDGKTLDVDSYADYRGAVKAVNNGQINFPVELTKAGYSDTYVISVVSKKDDVVTTETAKVSVKFVNTASYKDAKTAVITNVDEASDNLFDAYIVGSKIYLDFINAPADANVKFTFGDENGKAFAVTTYAYQPKVKKAAGYEFDSTLANLKGKATKDDEVKLDKSAATFTFAAAAQKETVKFYLETKAALYETKAYTIEARSNVKEEDPKGIYFAETSKTIAMGATYTPVVMGVKTGKAVAATLLVGKEASVDKQVIDILDGNTVVGTREGVAYITASYTTKDGEKTYTASSMKITVTLPGESIPAVGTEATVYYVTCRNLNVRAGAGTSYKKTGMVHRGDAVKVVEIKNGWAKLADNTYVCAKYIAK